MESKDLLECEPELPGHEAVEDEVNHAVSEGQHVHHLPQGGVAGDEELVSQQPRENAKYALKYLDLG